MVRFFRSGRIIRGKAVEGVHWAKKVSEFINTKYAPISFQTYVELFGTVNAVYWYADFEDLGSIEKLFSRLEVDQEYNALAQKSADFIADGTFYDKLMEAV